MCHNVPVYHVNDFYGIYKSNVNGKVKLPPKRKMEERSTTEEMEGPVRLTLELERAKRPNPYG
jgi:hypothetical protein